MANEVPPAQHGPVNRGNAEHYRWGDNCDAWYLVNDEQLSVIEELVRQAPPRFATITRRRSSSSTS